MADVDHSAWISNAQNQLGGSNSNSDHSININNDRKTFVVDDPVANTKKIKRKKIVGVGDNGVKKFVVRRKNSDFLTTTTTTESPFVFHDEHALNRTENDSRCELFSLRPCSYGASSALGGSTGPG